MTTTTTESPGTAAGIADGEGPASGGVPPTPTPTPPKLPPVAPKPKEPSLLGRMTVGFMLLGVGVLALLDVLPGVPIDAQPRHYMALAVTILGVGLLVGSLWGRARWLIIVAVVLVPTLFISPVFEWDWNTDTFDQQVRVTQFADLEEGYSIDVGNLLIDLRGLPWNGEHIELTADVDAGNLEVIVPNDVAVTGTGQVDIGRVGAPGRESAGIGSPSITFDIPGSEGSVDLDLRVDLGNIDVRVRG